MPKQTKQPESTPVEAVIEKQPIIFAALPLISVLKKRSDMEEAKKLLAEVDDIDDLVDGYKERRETIMLRLEELQKTAGTIGLRYGNFCYAAREMPGRTSLDKVKLMEQGVTPAQLKAAEKTGKPFMQREFKTINSKG